MTAAVSGGSVMFNFSSRERSTPALLPSLAPDNAGLPLAFSSS